MSYHFTLKREGWGYDDIYEAIKNGEKTSEWRPGSEFWKKRLLTPIGRQQLQWAFELKERQERNKEPGRKPYFLMQFPEYLWKYNRARFVVGYTKYPRLLADVKEIMYHSKINQFEILIENVVEEVGL